MVLPLYVLGGACLSINFVVISIVSIVRSFTESGLNIFYWSIQKDQAWLYRVSLYLGVLTSYYQFVHLTLWFLTLITGFTIFREQMLLSSSSFGSWPLTPNFFVLFRFLLCRRTTSFPWVKLTGKRLSNSGEKSS